MQRPRAELLVLDTQRGTSGGVMVNKLDEQNFMSEFDSHWVPNSYGIVLHLWKHLRKLQLRRAFQVG